MSDFPEYAIHRILVALDASTRSLAALHEAAEMAAALKAELIGLFVEDINLLRGASFPFVRRIAFPSGAFESIDVERMERELQAQAEQARQALAAAAEKSHRPWSFRRVRGSVGTQLLEAAAEADVVMLGRSGWAASSGAVLGSTARMLAHSAPGAILIVERIQAGRDPVQTVFDGSAGAARVVRTAASYALARGLGLVVFVVAATEQEYQQRLEQVRVIADHRFKHVAFQRLEAAAPALLIRAMTGHGSGLIFIPGASALAQDQALRALASGVPNPVLLIRDQQAPAPPPPPEAAARK